MRAQRRRRREQLHLASPHAVRRLLEELHERCPQIVPKSERQLLKMLEAIRHIERHPATDTKRGRPPRWKREDLHEVAGHLRALLQRETGGRVSIISFTSQYLRLLYLPQDVLTALEKNEINLMEAHELARLTPERLSCEPSEAKRVRAELLRSHTALAGSQNTLRARVKELLGEVVEVTTEGMTAVVQKVDELLEIDPSDKRHLFYEEMKRLFYAMREIQPDDIDDPALEEIMKAADQLSGALYSIELKKRQRERKPAKISI